MSSDSGAPKGSFSVEISEEAIQEALRAVESLEETFVREEETPGASPGEEVVVESDLSADLDLPLVDEVDGEFLEILEEAPAGDLRRELEETQGRYHQAEGEIRALRERIGVLASDMENLRRRSQREKEESERFAVEKLLVDLIPVLDNFDRAQEHARREGDPASLVEGVQMVLRLFEDTLGKFGVRSFRALGEPFDPAFHEAVQLRETEDHPPNTVVEEMVRGYLLHERLVRPAIVCVSVSPDGKESGEERGGGTAAS